MEETRAPLDTSEAHAELAEAKARLSEAIALQALEGNPATDEEILLVDRALREGWSDEQFTAAVLRNAGFDRAMVAPLDVAE